MKKFGMLLVSVVLVLCMAIGMTACGNNRGNGDNGGGEGNKPETPATPAITTDVSSLSLVKNEKVNVTATVANSDKSASFSLSAGSEDVVALSVSETTPNVATVTALNDGNATLTVALEGATSVSVPVTVDGIVAIVGDIIDQTKEFDAGETGKDDGETTTFTVKHFMGEDCKVEVTNGNDAVAELSESNGTYSLKALQAGVSEITVTLSAVKEETPDEGEEDSEPDAQSDDEETTPEYEEIYTNTLGFVCTDDWDKAAKADEISSKILNFKEVSGGYAAYIDRANIDVRFELEEFDGKLYVPAVYNRKPVVSIVKNQEDLGTSYFMAFETGVKKTQEEIDAIEDEDERNAAQDKNDIIEEYEAIYNEIDEVYLPCTFTSIPELTFRLAPVTKVEVQKGNHITVIGQQAFNQTANFESFNLVDCTELKTIKVAAFFQAGYEKEWEAVMPNSLTLIEYAAFTQSGVTKIEFQPDNNPENAVTIQGDYAAHTSQDPLKVGAFGSALKLKELYLRNIKSFHGNAICMATALEILSLDESFTVETFAGDNFGFWGCYKPYMGTAIVFEGANNKLVKLLAEDAATASGLGENCRGLLENVFTIQLPTVSGNVGAVFIPNEISDSEVAAVVKKLFTKQSTSTKDGYSLWTRSGYLYAGQTDKVDEGHVNPWLPAEQA